MYERERRARRRIIIISIAGTICILAGIYFGMTIYFRNHFLFRTEINGWKVGGMSVQKAEQKIGDHVEEYLLTVFDREGGKHHVYGKDIKCSYVPNGSVSKLLKKQNPFGWVVSVFKLKEEKASLTMKYEEELIAQAVSEMNCFQEEGRVLPQDAKILPGEEGYYVEPEVTGSCMIYDKVLEKVKTAVAKGAESVKLSEDDYENPQYKSDSKEVTKAMEKIEKYTNTSITYEVLGEKEKIEKAQMVKFIQVDENYQVSFNETEIEKFVQSMASKYNTYADVRPFKTSSGDTVEIGGGDYGWVVNKPKEAEQIKADMENGKPVKRELTYSQRAYVEGKDDIGNTYVEIDYTKQHMWYYENGTLVADTDIVTGNISRNNGSPDGVFKIVYKESPAVLRGEDYESNVTYFMPFAYNVGIHDASWRGAGEFGGEHYKTNGSHGCINAPFEVAETFYKKVKVGTPVIAYYREKVTLTAENCKISNAFSYEEPEETKAEP